MYVEKKDGQELENKDSRYEGIQIGM
jgi:hypothetical protein